MDLIQKYIASNKFGEYIGMHFTVISPGEVHYHLVVEAHHLATPQAAHGGAIAALVDAALGVAALSAVHEQNKVVSTVEYKLNFIAPARLHDELKAVGKVVKQGNRLLVVSCDVYCTNRNNELVAKAIGTFNAYDAKKAGY